MRIGSLRCWPNPAPNGSSRLSWNNSGRITPQPNRTAACTADKHHGSPVFLRTASLWVVIIPHGHGGLLSGTGPTWRHHSEAGDTFIITTTVAGLVGLVGQGAIDGLAGDTATVGTRAIAGCTATSLTG